jgi:4a-hydroxytetrahydrobiopterin dehydratase
MTWNHENNTLTTTYSFSDFTEAMKFVNDVAKLAEQEQHHPDIDIRYNEVHLTLTTHDKGNTVTQKDLSLADKIQTLHKKNYQN